MLVIKNCSYYGFLFLFCFSNINDYVSQKAQTVLSIWEGVGRVCGGEIAVVVIVGAVVTLAVGGGGCASRCGGKRHW